jgi:hypothetical protein
MERKIGWKLRSKVLTGYGLALCLIVAVIVWSLANMKRLGRAKDNIASEPLDRGQDLIRARKFRSMIKLQID